MTAKTYRSLSIGNSFSQDALEYAHAIAAADGICWQTVNMDIGGCTLERHWKSYAEDIPDYDYEYNGEVIREGAVLREVLQDGKYDIITLQQGSHLSGKPESYQPYLTDLVSEIRKIQPGAKLYLQETWAYDWACTYSYFADYHKDQHEMYRRIRDAYARAAESVGAGIIPVGDVIQHIRDDVPGFDTRNGGRTLNYEDGFHLSLPYGRFLNSLVWYSVLFDADVRKNTFVPETAEDTALIRQLKELVYGYFHPTDNAI
ncbi:MAG: DUF4886 domain-containing protein [Clostridia bacterium]|nr:DUF4886 domain-containing protein [Clostridia bacterium]